MDFKRFTNFIGNILYTEEEEMKAVIKPVGNGRTGLYYAGGALIKDYARARDAKRGAERLGLSVIPA